MTQQLRFGEVPFSRDDIERLFEKQGRDTVYVYDLAGIQQTCRDLDEAFGWVPTINGTGFQNFFAVKANPNPYLLMRLREEGQGADCSSAPELVLSHLSGIRGENIMFTSNDTPRQEFLRARKLGAVMNLDDIGHLAVLEQMELIPDLISFRVNPGGAKKGNNIIGDPKTTKYGVPIEFAKEAYRNARDLGAKRFGMHTMVVSNMRDESYLIDTSRLLFDLAKEISNEVGIPFEFINLGGGVGVQYHPETQSPVNLKVFGEGVKKEYGRILKSGGLEPRVVTECGRAITGPHGWLLTRVRHIAKKYRTVAGVDACMADLMRPGMYTQINPDGSVDECYHHITVLGKEGVGEVFYDVVGSLCEGIDKFAIQRKLPSLEVGDILVVHTAGAHGRAMGFNYNGKLRCGEELLEEEGVYTTIRRPENMRDLFSTLTGFPNSWSALSEFNEVY